MQPTRLPLSAVSGVEGPVSFGLYNVKKHVVSQITSSWLYTRRPACIIRLTRNAMINRKNKIFAIPAAANATPPKPRIPAMRAITKNTNA